MEEREEESSGCSSTVVEKNPDSCLSSGVLLLADEKFDFDLSLSPLSGNEEDEVFVGPPGHKEKCIAVSIETVVEESQSAKKKRSPPPDDKLTWSPLSGEKFVEIFKEAHLLALQLKKDSREELKVSQFEEPKSKNIEKFVQDSKSKLNIFQKGKVEKSPKTIKRETYCVWDSPACQLPPSFQKQLELPMPADSRTHALQTPSNASSPVKIRKSSKLAISSLAQKQQTDEKNKKVISKLQTAKVSAAFGKNNQLTIEKPKPGKQLSPSGIKHLNSMGSSEDLLSDKSSTASDVCNASFNGSSTEDKKTLPVPSKLGLRKATQLKPPGAVTGPQRKNTSSSSSSVSSMSSSVSVSPAGGNAKSNLPSKTSVSSSKLSSTISRQSLVKSVRVSSANSDLSCKQARSASTPRTPTVVNSAKSSVFATASQTVASGIQRLNSVPNLQKLNQQNKDGSGIKGSSCPKPKAKVVPTTQIKVPKMGGGTSLENAAPKIAESIRLPSCSILGSGVAVSTPVRVSEDGPWQNSCRSTRSLSMTPASIKRSALPTPINRRTSGIPVISPKSVPRFVPSRNFTLVHQVSSTSNKKILTSCSKQATENKARESSSEDEISPPPVVPLILDFSPEKSTVDVLQTEVKEETKIPNNSAEETQTNEVLLVDIGMAKTPSAISEWESRPLIDLSNTPDVNNAVPLKPTVLGQVPDELNLQLNCPADALELIDLSSPLITLSPDMNKENLDSPLLKF
ncbi:G2 and S phase-expressed protein 1 isoform X2 [Alligator mississippiensis]|uniref:G2 and S phase-expressed protein 1 isoform X2 n=1 Tax=Alligator mississippiensis TaxID=8496 RepID=UPI0007120F99|nr:G2 and S phase-expressed protein 1 isoform X2 [Alligator mississippiensis]